MTTPPNKLPHTEACWTQVICLRCGLRKKPVGRSAPLVMAASLCDDDCQGYREPPLPPHYWSKQEYEDE